MFQNEFIPFGAQYYRAPTPYPDQWEQDLHQIREIGFNTIKIWAQWRWNNPQEGVYDFTDLDRLMDLAAEQELSVIINIICDVAPSWFYKKYPESIMMMSDGRKLAPRATGYRQIGGAPGPCYHHVEGIQSRQSFIKELAKRYHQHSALYVWDLWNEPELTCGIAREPKQEDMVCYCPVSEDAFMIWLKERYRSMNELNKAWNRNYQNWEEVELPRSSDVFNDMIDWRMFFADTLTAELQMRVNAVKGEDLRHPVMVHTVPMPYFNRINACSDDYKLAELCDLFGNSIGSHPFAAAIATSSAMGKKVINAEIHALGGNTYNRPGIPSLEEIKRHILIPLARGIKGFLFWQYRPETLGVESPAWGLTTLAGEKTDWLDYSIQVNNMLQDNKALWSKVEPLPARIAIINGAKNEIFDWCVSHSIDRHYNSVMGVFMALYNNQILSDVISTDQVTPTILERYTTIYYPFPYYIEDRVAEVLKNWIHKGGTLISEVFFGGVRESDGLHSLNLPGFNFDKVFGVREGIATTASTFSNAYGAEWSKEDIHKNRLPLLLDDGSLIDGQKTNEQKTNAVAGYFFYEELIPSTARVLVRFAAGGAAITINDFGQGQAILIGTLLGYLSGKEEDAAARKLIASLARLGGIRPVIETDISGIRVDLLQGGIDLHALIVVNDQQVDQVVTLTFSTALLNARQAIHLMTGQKYEVETFTNEQKLRLPIKALGCDAYQLITPSSTQNTGEEKES